MPDHHCAKHPSVVAPFVCERCGVFFCLNCGVPGQASEGPLCGGCVSRSADELSEALLHQSAPARLASAAQQFFLLPYRHQGALDRMGHRGGFATLAGALSAVGLGVTLLALGLGVSGRVVTLGLGALYVGVGLALKGLRAVRRPARRPPMSHGELLERLKFRPVVVCLACRAVVATIPCNECGSSAECLEVRTDDDEKMALAALEP
jgi:hypothetical protein